MTAQLDNSSDGVSAAPISAKATENISGMHAMGSAPTAPPPHRSFGQLVRSVTDGIRSLFRKEAELAKLEMVDAISARAKGAGMFAAAAVCGVFALAFLAAAGAAALAIVLPTWAAIAIVGGVFLAAGGVTLLVARGRMRSPSIAPEQTRRTLQEDVAWAKQQIKR